MRRRSTGGGGWKTHKTKVDRKTGKRVRYTTIPFDKSNLPRSLRAVEGIRRLKKYMVHYATEKFTYPKVVVEAYNKTEAEAIVNKVRNPTRIISSKLIKSLPKRAKPEPKKVPIPADLKVWNKGTVHKKLWGGVSKERLTWVDKPLRPIVKQLWRIGVTTTSSCAGHILPIHIDIGYSATDRRHISRETAKLLKPVVPKIQKAVDISARENNATFIGKRHVRATFDSVKDARGFVSSLTKRLKKIPKVKYQRWD